MELERNYYFLTAALPPLVLGEAPPISFRECREMLEENLPEEDQAKVKQLFFSVDLRNIRALWLNEPFDERGNFGTKELEEELLVQDQLPLYVVDFLDRYPLPEERLRYFAALYALYYSESVVQLTGFLRSYCEFEREMRLVLTGLRAKRTGGRIAYELQFEDPRDPFVAHLFAQEDAAEYSPPQEYEELKEIFVEHGKKPYMLERALLTYRFKRVAELEEETGRSIDTILGYLVRLGIVEAFRALEKRRPDIVQTIGE